LAEMSRPPMAPVEVDEPTDAASLTISLIPLPDLPPRAGETAKRAQQDPFPGTAAPTAVTFASPAEAQIVQPSGASASAWPQMCP
jgi:hypothetical protein